MLADTVLSTTLIEGSRKKMVPGHIPSPATPRNVLTHCLDIRAVPSKAMLRCLVEYTKDEAEKRRLQELCSRQGATEYAQFIREAHFGIMDVLLSFPSCFPPLHRLYGRFHTFLA